MNSISGLGSSRRHLQSGNSLSGSLHCGINNNSDDDILPIPRPPLPPTSIPPHLILNCKNDDPDIDDDDIDVDVDDDDDDDDDVNMGNIHQNDIFFGGSGDRFANGDSV